LTVEVFGTEFSIFGFYVSHVFMLVVRIEELANDNNCARGI
jgi:hypothetical protein